MNPWNRQKRTVPHFCILFHVGSRSLSLSVLLWLLTIVLLWLLTIVLQWCLPYAIHLHKVVDSVRMADAATTTHHLEWRVLALLDTEVVPVKQKSVCVHADAFSLPLNTWSRERLTFQRGAFFQAPWVSSTHSTSGSAAVVPLLWTGPLDSWRRWLVSPWRQDPASTRASWRLLTGSVLRSAPPWATRRSTATTSRTCSRASRPGRGRSSSAGTGTTRLVTAPSGVAPRAPSSASELRSALRMTSARTPPSLPLCQALASPALWTRPLLWATPFQECSQASLQSEQPFHLRRSNLRNNF